MAVSNRRLWFHLDEVLPLAEHAMVCRHHPPTGAPTGPALVITHTSDGDLLTSNGHPRWHDATGNVHAAQARSWRQPGTGRRGSPFHADRPTAYLPLHHTANGEPPVIDVLRAGRHLDRQWATIDLHPTDQLLTYACVGVPEHRDELVPADARWTATTVNLPGCGVLGLYPALTAVGYTTDDGDVIARFDRRTAARMVADLEAVDRAATMPGEYPVLRFDGDVLVLLEDDEDHDGSPILTETDRYHPDSDGFYSLGAYLLPWTATGDPVQSLTRLRFAVTRFATRVRRSLAALDDRRRRTP